MNNSILIFSLTFIFMSSTFAYATDSCSDATYFIKATETFEEAEPSLTNIVSPKLTIVLKARPGFPEPNGLLYRFNGEGLKFELDERGQIIEQEKMAGLSHKGEVCILIDGKIVPKIDDAQAEATILFQYPFRKKSDTYDVADIYEASEDSNELTKQFVEEYYRSDIIGMKAVYIEPYGKSGLKPEIKFLRNGSPVAVPIASYEAFDLVRLEDIIEAEVDHLKLTGEHSIGMGADVSPEYVKARQAEGRTIIADEE